MRWIVVLLAALLLVTTTTHAAPTRQKPIALKKGLPKADGLGMLVIVTNFPGNDKRGKAIKAYAKARGAKVVKFKKSDVASARTALRRAGAEFVAFAVLPETVDTEFHYAVLELCRDLDADPMPDFHFGYLTARDGPDLTRLLAAIEDRAARSADEPQAKIIALTGDGKQLLPLDYVLHFGHGQAWRVDNGMTGEQVGKLYLPRAPVVWSGACFNGVLSRSWHKSARQLIWLTPTTVDPKYLMTLNWIHAGISGYLAALEGDRGEMAVAEWEYFRSKACALGEAIGYQYRLAFTSVYADFTTFPRHVPGSKQRKSFYDVMLRGMVSRILISDPSLRPMDKPLDEPVHAVDVGYDAEAKRIEIVADVLRFSNGAHVNCLPKKAGYFDRRCYVRVAVPPDVPAKFDDVTVEARNGSEVVAITRHHLRHEVWGGRRYLNLQIEAPAGQIKKGTQVRWRLPVR